MDKRDNFKKDIMSIINLCNKELIDRKNNIDGEATEEQIENCILPELKELSTKINSNNLPEEKERYLISFGNILYNWGWDLRKSSNLGRDLAKLNEDYRNL